jgi:hypothetical protein
VAAAGSDPKRKLRYWLVVHARALGATDCVPDEWLDGVQESARLLREATANREQTREITRQRSLAEVMRIDPEELR